MAVAVVEGSPGGISIYFCFLHSLNLELELKRPQSKEEPNLVTYLPPAIALFREELAHAHTD